MCRPFGIVAILAALALTEQMSAQNRFIRGDCDGDGQVAGIVTDAVFLLRYCFAGGPVPPCEAACDANDDGKFCGNVTDALYLLSYNFLGGSAPPAPYPECGTDSTPDGLSCLQFATCEAALVTGPVTLEPGTGSSEVGVTVRPKATFPGPVDTTSLDSSNFFASFAGEKLPAKIIPAHDGSFAWLFFDAPMPNASQV